MWYFGKHTGTSATFIELQSVQMGGGGGGGGGGLRKRLCCLQCDN